jgi:hypothetical protein
MFLLKIGIDSLCMVSSITGSSRILKFRGSFSFCWALDSKFTFFFDIKNLPRNSDTLGGHGCQIFLGTTYQHGKKYTQSPQYTPKGHKVCLPNGHNISNSCHSVALQNRPKFGFFAMQIYHLATMLLVPAEVFFVSVLLRTSRKPGIGRHATIQVTDELTLKSLSSLETTIIF